MRVVKAFPVHGHVCSCCRKHTARRKGKAPAPIQLIVSLTVMDLCMVCAKRIVSQLDTVIDHIEESYE